MHAFHVLNHYFLPGTVTGEYPNSDVRIIGAETTDARFGGQGSLNKERND